MSDSDQADDVDLSAGQWRRSSVCANSGCIEVSASGGVIRVRDSKQDGGPILSFDANEWKAFVAGVKNDEFEI